MNVISTLQELNKFNMRCNEQGLARFSDNLIKAIDHIKFCIKLYIRQMNAGRYWLHEHPWPAKSEQIPEMEELLKDPRVQVAYADRCQFVLTAKIKAGSDARGLAKKPTGFISNSWTIAHRLRRTCKQDHEHVKLEGGRAKAAALYPDELCMEMCQGFIEQIEHDAKGLKCLGGLSKTETEELIQDMIDTATDFFSEEVADETIGSHGDLPHD